MLSNSRSLFLLFVIIYSSSAWAQIFFENDNNGQPAKVAVGQLSGQSHYAQDDDDQGQENQEGQENHENSEDYYDEVVHGHRIRDPEKFRRQLGCLCNHQLKDPHCGSDLKMYDNGCYFECAQKRNSRLNLRNWGPCL